MSGVDGYLRQAVDDAMRLVIVESAEDALGELVRGDKIRGDRLTTGDPEVLAEAIHRAGLYSADAWAMLDDAAGEWVDGTGDWEPVCQARFLVKLMAKEAGALVDRLSTVVEEEG